MATLSPTMEFLGRIAYEATRMRPLLPTYGHLIISAVFPIYAGAHASLSQPSSAAKPGKVPNPSTEDADEEEEKVIVQKMEGLSPSDAIVFPLLAGGTLTSLYFLLKWLQDPAILNRLLGYYFAQIGVIFGVKFVKDSLSVFRSFLFPRYYSANGGLWKADDREKCYKTSHTNASETGIHLRSPFPGFLRRIQLPKRLSDFIWTLRRTIYQKAQWRFHMYKLMTITGPVDVLDLLSLLIAGGVVMWHTVISKPWWLTNFLGFSFCYGSLQYISPTTSWTGTLLLSALFFYDIYFVFFTPMMVTVATKLDVPIKLLFPRPNPCILPLDTRVDSPAMDNYVQCLEKRRTMAMLGLGDIVIPGIMIAFALRFDLFLFYLRQSRMKKSPGETVYPTPPKQRGDQEDKSKYLSAVGSWGERFWTSPALRPAELKAKKFPKRYFHASLAGYVIGLTTTLVVMQVTEHAQPALLYLVPGVLGSLWSTALFSGGVKELWRFTEAAEDDEEGKEKDKKMTVNKNEKKDKSKSGETEENEGKRKSGQDGEETKKSANDSTKPKTARGGDGKSKDQPKPDPDEKKDKPVDLMSFSITLPRQKPQDRKPDTTTTTIDPNKIFNDLAEAMSTEISAPSAAENGVAPEAKPDIDADRAVLSRIESSLREREEATVKDEGEGVDGEPPEKRRRKA